MFGFGPVVGTNYVAGCLILSATYHATRHKVSAVLPDSSFTWLLWTATIPYIHVRANSSSILAQSSPSFAPISFDFRPIGFIITTPAHIRKIYTVLILALLIDI